MHVHAQTMNEYREGEMLTEVDCILKFVDEKSESVPTTPPCFGLTKLQIIFDVAAVSKCRDEQQRMFV